MEFLLLTLLVTAPAPNVTAGPGLAASALAVKAPIEKVTVYSDRAKILRRAAPRLRAGIQALRLPDLPGAAFLDTVRVGAHGAKVLRIETTPIERERWSIEQIEGQIERFEKLQDQLAVLRGLRQLPVWEKSFLSKLRPAHPIPEKDRSPRNRFRILPNVWLKVLGFLDARLEKAHGRVAELDAQTRELAEKAQLLEREIDRHGLGAITDRKVQVLAIVDKPAAGKARIELEYFVPGASWVPSYGLRFSADVSSVVLESAGQVRQATGEDWQGVELALSTAIPGRSIEMPELLTWTLGSQREWIPRALPARRSARAKRLPPPTVSQDPSEAKRLARMEVLKQRVQELRVLRQRLANEAKVARVAGAAGYGSGDAAGRAPKTPEKKRHAGRGRSRSRARRGAAMAPAAAAAPGAPPSSVLKTFEFADDSAMISGSVAGGVGGLGMSGGGAGGGGIRKAKRRGRTPATSLSLYEPSYYRPPTFSNRKLPAVLAGGLDYTYAAPAKATIPSRGHTVRVPLATSQYKVTTFYEATPSLSKTAYLKATIKNDGKRPVLAGRAAIFVGNEFGGDAELQTTGPGGIVELPLGADEDIRITHTLVPSTETKGLISKEEVTTYNISIEVGNYKKRPVQVFVVDQIPKARQEEIDIELLATTPGLEKGPTADGIVRWKLKIPAGKTQKTTLRYRLTRPEGWKLRQTSGGR